MERPAKVVIVGTGAMGSVYAALMADAGHEVWAVDSWTAHVGAMQNSGLRVEGFSGDRTVRLNATETAADAGEADLVIIATKLNGVEAAAEAIKPCLRDDTAILSVQNGLGGPDIAARVLGPERVTIGVVGGFGASMKGPGHAHHNGMQMVRLGEYQGDLSERTERIAEIWRSSGFDVSTFSDIHKMVWEKLICNCAYSGPCTLTGLNIGGVMDNPHASEISQACAAEAWQVARAKGIAVETDDPVAYVRAFGARMPAAVPSMAQDHAARKVCEVDAINGAIPREGAPLGIATPMNHFVTTLIKARESTF